MTTWTNLCPNPRPATVTGWSGAAGTVVTAPWGRSAFQTTTDGVNLPYVFSAIVGAAIPAGTVVTIRAKIFHSDPAATVQVSIHGRSPNAYLFSSPVITAGATWQEIVVTGTLAAQVTQLDVSLVQQSVPPAGQTMIMGDVLIETGSGSGAYYDGDAPDTPSITYAWTGAANASTSSKTTVLAPTLQLDWVPSQGAVRFTVFDVPDDDKTTVKRVNPGGTLTAIRGYPDGTWHSLTGLGYDYEAPMSVYVRYAICDRDAKNLTATMVTAVIFTETPGRTNGEAWLRDVLQPVLSRPVSVVSTGEEVYAARQTVLDVAGKRTPYVVWDSRQARQGTITLVTENTVVPTVYNDSTERDKLEALFATGRPLLLSMCANKGFRNAYLAIDSVSFTRVGKGPTWLIDMAYFQVDNPTGLGVNIVPEVTYAMAQQLPPAAIYQDWAGTGIGDGLRYFDVATRTALP